MRKARRNFAGLAPGRALVTALAVIALLALLSWPSWAVDAPEAPKAAEGKAAKAGAQEPVSPDEAPEATEEAEPPEPPKLPASARSMAHLYELMSREPPMTDSDLASYEKYAGDIVAMAENPELMERIALVSGWTVGRLTYVTVKV